MRDIRNEPKGNPLSMTKVLIDGQIFSVQARGGIGRVFTSIFKEFNSKEGKSNFESTLHLGALFSRYLDFPKRNFFSPPYLYRGSRFKGIFLKINWFFNWFSKYDLVHSTYYYQNYLYRKPGTKHVVTVHDMIPEDYPHYFPNGNPHLSKKKFIENADYIICVSEHTRERLMYHFPHLETEISTVYPGVEIGSKITFTNSPSRKLLYVGNRDTYKGFSTLLNAVPILRKIDSRVSLLAVGGGEFNSEESNYINLHNLQDIVSQRHLTDEELEFEYRNCLANVITSEIEGFGLPLIEGMAQGALIVATDIPVFNEIAPDGFLKFSFGDTNSLVNILNKIVENPQNFTTNRIIGYEISKQYSWKKSAVEMDQIYSQLRK